MALETTPFFIGNGAEHSAAVARTVAFAATGGKSGIADRADLKVTAQSVPNGSVRVAPGVATIVNTYAGGSGQAYVARNLSQSTITINPTGSAAARSDLIVLSVTDPEFIGSAPEDPNAFEYTQLEVISGVPANTKSLDGLGFNKPAIALARVDIPKSTGTITNGMITSLRALANPRSERSLFTHGITQDEGMDELQYSVAGNPDGEMWPNHAWQVEIPEWAQRVRVQAFWGQVRVPGIGGNNTGHLWVRFGTMPNGFSSQTTRWDVDATVTGVTRETYMCAADRDIPEAFKGSVRNIYLRGSVSNNNKNTPRIDAASAISLDVEFYEVPV